METISRGFHFYPAWLEPRRPCCRYSVVPLSSIANAHRSYISKLRLRKPHRTIARMPCPARHCRDCRDAWPRWRLGARGRLYTRSHPGQWETDPGCLPPDGTCRGSRGNKYRTAAAGRCRRDDPKNTPSNDKNPPSLCVFVSLKRINVPTSTFFSLFRQHAPPESKCNGRKSGGDGRVEVAVARAINVVRRDRVDPPRQDAVGLRREDRAPQAHRDSNARVRALHPS